MDWAGCQPELTCAARDRAWNVVGGVRGACRGGYHAACLGGQGGGIYETFIEVTITSLVAGHVGCMPLCRRAL